MNELQFVSNEMKQCQQKKTLTHLLNMNLRSDDPLLMSFWAK